MKCTNCGSSAIDFADNQAVCSQCGVVLEESQIVSDITFGENSAGGAVVQGSMIAADQARARVSGPSGFRGGYVSESREMTISNARIGINNMASALRIPSHVADRALRFFTLALDGGASAATGDEPKNYVLGRKSEYTVASCLYVACRMEKTTHMLIDFADAIQVNVFVLGRSYLKLIRILNLRLPLIDPSIYIARFAALLDFGEETQKVAYDASRLVSRFQKDWITEGRRPAGICGACLMLAARMNHFRRSVSEVIQVVKIADVTLKARLEEFKKTPTGQLSVQDFRNVWLEEEHAPPAYLRAVAPPTTKRKRKSNKNIKLEGIEVADDSDAADADADAEGEADAGTSARTAVAEDADAIDPALEKVVDEATEQEIQQYLQQSLAQELDKALETQEREREERAKSGQVASTSSRPAAASDAGPIPDANGAGPSGTRDPSLDISRAGKLLPLGGLGMDVQSTFGDDAEAALDGVADDADATSADRRRSVGPHADELADLDEDELDRFILSPEEVRIKERVWMEFNKDWMEQMLKKQLKLEHDQKMGVPIREPYKRKKPKAPRDASTAMHNTSAAESAKMMLKQKQFSKKINYDALNNLFPGAKVVGGGSGKGGSGKTRSGARKGRKRGRQQSSDESSSEEEEEDAAANGKRGKKGRKGKKASKKSQGTAQGYFESDNNDSQMEVVEEDGEMLPPSHPLRRKETRLNKRGAGQLSSAAEESATDLGEEMNEPADGGAMLLNEATMRSQLGYFNDDTEDD
ncbi:Transcription factor TFIIB, cyclin-like domain protein [Kalmanozyma brasiliensis GHG001]|uniref:B-related factor 1 n=1 Tax=Kalmanozyma brasiliensis (strain GHG001) TaxID=1365824 RepID=V5GKD5_KALBG|nr:Transcription factor TFIIB, cyclin-like domain protein [Kalmanozyma brasiliensis GHG001]EST06427.1 Transcription factor TFIIB, cyclin-like domain protein [Kalmanozyma brasiliensis GHG001]